MRYSIALLWMTTVLAAGPVLAQAAPVPILTGGVGAMERAMLETQQQDYSVKLVFSGQGGAYVADVQVTIRDAQRQVVVETMTDGPILLAKLPAGKYTAQVTGEGIHKSVKLDVGSQLKTYNVVLPVKDDADLTDSKGGYLPRESSGLDDGYIAPPADAPDAQ